MTETTQEAVLRLTRAIPVPTSVSPQARDAIAAGSGAVAQRLAHPEVFPALDDAAAWKARIAAMDEMIALGFAARSNSLDAGVEKIEIDGIDVYVITPAGADTSADTPMLYDIHGGALIAGGGDVCRMMATTSATRAGLHTWSVDYRMPPDHPYPTPLDDCVTVSEPCSSSNRPTRSWSTAGRRAATSPPR
jgi:monoterpene epsilon-lactone hydrolase